MAMFKKLLAFMLGGAILGAVAASFIGPALIGWYNEPGFAAPPGFNLAPFVRQVMSSLLQAQLIGAVSGAVALLVLGVVIVRSAAKRSPATPSGKGLPASAAVTETSHASVPKDVVPPM